MLTDGCGCEQPPGGTVKKGCSTCKALLVAGLMFWAWQYGAESMALEVFIPADAYTVNQPGAVYTWVAKDTGLTTNPLGGENYIGGDVTTAPRLDYLVAVPVAGTYYVWAQGLNLDGHTDSFWVGIDEPTKLALTGFDPAGLTWAHDIQGDAGNQVTVALAAGINTLSIWMREPALYFQTLLLTDNPAWRPAPGPTGINTSNHVALDGRFYVVDTGQEVTLGWDAYDTAGGVPDGFTVTLQSMDRSVDTVKRILPGAGVVEYKFSLPRTGLWKVCVEAFNKDGNSEQACSSDPTAAQVEGTKGAWWISAKIAAIPGGIETGE